MLQDEEQSFLEMLSVKVNDTSVADAEAFTVTEAPVVDPAIVPLPEIVQEWVTVPPPGVTVEV